MRSTVAIFLAALLFLSACAPSGGGTPVMPGTPVGAVGHSAKSALIDEENQGSFPEVPANTNSKKIPYTVGGDERVVKEIQTNRPDVKAPLTPAQEKEAAFSDSIRDAKLSRYNEKGENFNLGKKSFKLIMQVQMKAGNKITVTYTGDLKKASDNSFELAKVKSTKVGYGLTGTITDGQTTSIGKFEATFNDSRANIYYRAYKVKWDIRTKESQDWKNLDDLKSKIERMKEAADQGAVFGWAQNLVVGTVSVALSVCHYDFLNVGAMAKIKTDDMPSFSFDCESIRRGIAEPSAVSKLENKTGDVENVKVEGDGEDSDSRVFSATVKNKKNQQVEVLMIATRDGDAPEKALPENQRPQAKAVEPAKTETVSQPPQNVEDQWDISDDDLPMTQKVIEKTTQQILQPQPQQQKQAQSQPRSQNQQPALTQEQQQQQRQLQEQRQREYQELVRLQQEQAQQAEAAKKQSKPTVQAIPQQPRPQVAGPQNYRGIGPNAFLYTNYNNPKLPRTKRVIDAFERTYGVAQVQKQIAEQGNKMRRFFYYATPFVDLIQSIGETYDMPPAFVFMIVNESVYFSGRVKLQGTQYSEYSWDNPPPPHTTAGPFQIVKKTARNNYVLSQDNRNSPSDERNYFTPSACGAALYLSRIMDMFRDPTLGIMAYFRGENAILPIVRAAVKRYSDYSLTYADIARNHMVNEEWTRYVARVLAAYFIAGDYPHYLMYDAKTKQPQTNPKKLSEIPSAYPGLSKGQPAKLWSPTCQKAFDRLYQTSNVPMS